MALIRLLPLAPLALLGAGLVVHIYRLEARAERQAVQLTAQRLAQALDAAMTGSERTLRALALSHHVVADDWVGFRAEAVRMAPFVLGNNIVVYDASGVQLVNTLLPEGAPLPRHPATPPGLIDALGRQQAALTDLFTGPVTGTRLVALGVPVTGASAPRGVGTGISPDQVARVLETANLPEGWIAATLDRVGTITARTREANRFVGQPAVAPLRKALGTSGQGVLETRSLEGLAVVLAYQRIERLGWTVAVGAPDGAQRAERVRHAVLGMTLVLLGLVAGAWFLRPSVVYLERAGRASSDVP